MIAKFVLMLMVLFNLRTGFGADDYVERVLLDPPAPPTTYEFWVGKCKGSNSHCTSNTESGVIFCLTIAKCSGDDEHLVKKIF